MKKKIKALFLIFIGLGLIYFDIPSLKNFYNYLDGEYRGENLVKEKYSKGDYEYVLKTDHNLLFLKANSIVKLNEKEPQDKTNDLNKSLDLYKGAILQKDDLNIKKNYEIVLAKMNQNKKKEQKEQEQEQKEQEKQSQETEKDESKKNKELNKEESIKKSALNSEKVDKKNESNRELQYILQKLEESEKQSFKNNERYINQNNKKNSNKW